MALRISFSTPPGYGVPRQTGWGTGDRLARLSCPKADLSSTPRKSREGDVAGVLAEVAGSGSGHVGRGSVRATVGRGLMRSA